MGIRKLELIAGMQGSSMVTVPVVLHVPEELREERSGVLGAIVRNRTRILIATLNGLVAFLFGLVVETAFMRFVGVGHDSAYVLQNVFSTQLSFLLARYVTWRDRRIQFFRTLARYNSQQLATTLLSIALFAGLNMFGTYYVAANLIVTIAVAPLSWLRSRHDPARVVLTAA
jgi:putative flippase GtrA